MMRLKMFVFVVVAGCLVACRNLSPTSPEEPEVTVQSVSLSSLIPQAGSILSSARTLTAEVAFSFPRAEYPLQAGLTFWTVIPGSTGWHQFGEGRGCVDTSYEAYEPVKKLRCEFYLDPIIWEWWQRDGVKKVVLVFRARNASHPGYGIGGDLMYQEFDINYQVP